MSTTKSYDLQYLKSISNDDKKFIEDMVGDFLTNTPDCFNKMEGALADKDYQTLYHLIHKYIPTLNFVGANAKIDSFELLEKLAFTGDEPEKTTTLFYELKAYTKQVCDELEADLSIKPDK